ncbi:AAA family ATPase
MRINRLDLTRYGKFTDSVIDFGEPGRGTPDLHVIYGPNEAGKSTTFDAILDLIFGIGTSSKYGFLHPYPTMRIGANIEIAGESREFVRIKRPQNSLLDSDGRSLPDALIRTDLGGIDRDAFTTMFSLDEKTLEKGGEGILASKGDLGELLFSASAGLSDLSRQLSSIRGEADVFYRYRARSGALADFKTELTTLKEQRAALDLRVSDFQRLSSERAHLSRLHEDALEQRAATQRRMDDVRRILAALSPMARLSTLKGEFSQTEEVPVPPSSWCGELPGLRSSEIEYRVKLEQIARSIAEIEREAEKLAPDPVALELSARVAELSDLQPRYITAENDIPKLSARAAELSIESILVQLGRPGDASPVRLILDAPTVGTLRALMEGKSGVDARLTSAKDECAKVERAIAVLSASNSTTDLSPDKVKTYEQLAATVKTIPRSDEEVALRSLSRRRDAASVALAETLSRLLPWRGSIGDLSSMACPSSVKLEQWKTSFKLATEQARRARADLDRLEPEGRRLDAEIDAVRSLVSAIDEMHSTDSRALRDEAWATHRKTMDDATADAFEEAMKSDDHLVSQRLLHFSEIGKLNQLLQRNAAVRTDVETARHAQREALDRQEEIRSEITARLDPLIAGSSLEADPFELEDWLRKREDVLKARDELADVDREIADVRDRVGRSRRLLIEAMDAANVGYHPDADIAALVAAAEDAVNDFNSAFSQATQMRRLQAECVDREQALADASFAAEAWQSEWKLICESSWLGELDVIPGTGAMSEILSTLEKLASAIESRDGLIDRVQKMEKDRALFEARALDLCEKLGIPTEGSPRELAHRIFERVRLAGLNQERREELGGELEDARKEESDLKAATEVLDARLLEMFAFFGVTTLGEVEAQMEIAERRQELSRSISGLEQELLQISGVADMSALRQLVASVDKQDLEGELARLTPVLTGQDQRCSEVFHQRSKVQDALDAIGGDARVAQLEEKRRTILLDIEESARRYMELRAGVAAAEQALRLYRERHRSGMMARASAAFNMISRGAYSGVAAQPGQDGEVLIAVSSSGGSNAANELSKGARFQLYLALRVAGYHEFLGSRPPVPFVADDIMESFDDFRAEETFRLFAEMAQRGQVVYLTHHRHLIEIARSVCPGVRLHDLEAIATAGKLTAVAAE